MKISILIPCYNEEVTIERCVLSCIRQTRPADEIIVVDDSSTDKSPEILKKFDGLIKIVRTPQNTGKKSHAQEYGLRFVTGDIYIMTDGDTMLHPNFVKNIEEEMKDESVSAIAGYVKSLKHNWITNARALDYAIGQNIDKLAQAYLGFIFVIPGAAGAFRTNLFKEKLPFTHDTVTEDLDFTYRLNKMGLKIKYSRRAICYTQDPPTLHAYINQMRRWSRGGWQNIKKHAIVPTNPGMALELSLSYIEGLVFSLLLFVLPIINLYLTFIIFLLYSTIMALLAVFGAYKEKRAELLLALPYFIFLRYVNSYIFIEQFVKEIILQKKDLTWFKPERVEIKKEFEYKR